MGGQTQEEKHEAGNGARLPGVTPAPDRADRRRARLESAIAPAPDKADRRRARREAAMRVLAELAAEDAETIPAPVQPRS